MVAPLFGNGCLIISTDMVQLNEMFGEGLCLKSSLYDPLRFALVPLYQGDINTLLISP